MKDRLPRAVSREQTALAGPKYSAVRTVRYTARTGAVRAFAAPATVAPNREVQTSKAVTIEYSERRTAPA